MADEKNQVTLKVPGLEPVPYVVVTLPDGRKVLRHPDELRKK